MRVLVLGSGGREHALYLKLQDSPLVTELFAAPGNGGIEPEHCIDLSVQNFSEIGKACKEYKIDVIIVGPEDPLANGIVDYFTEKLPQVRVFGPDAASAQLEASKIHAWEFMRTNTIPAPKSQAAYSLAEAEKALYDLSVPIVLKADGLAAGKGVSIHESKEEAEEQLKALFQDSLFGSAGEQVLLQKPVNGTEASLFAVLNGKEAVYLPTARDYKRSHDGDTGRNTGGMGSYAPGDVLNHEHIQAIHERVTKPILKQYNYRGVLYIGLMVHSGKATDFSVIEFNCRFGDPEAQCVLPLLESDFMQTVLWSLGENDWLPCIERNGIFYLPQKPQTSLNVVIAAKGYPGSYEKNLPLKLPETKKDIHIVQAGTKREGDNLVSTGGRVCHVVGLADSLEDSRKKVYSYLKDFDAMPGSGSFHYRKDIGKEES